ncbi:MAG: Dam family site-specific DNA-(adenine-N6)-methyltransferase [Elusimicrobia bacterium]|nr:Dam family site-specific DNA-(adenine-N6)-methyltransferase [Elusimicrobiota bacterium]
MGLRYLGFETASEYAEICRKRLARSPRPAQRGAIPSLLKWTGSKRSQAHAIARLMPGHRRYFEPFVGGGALLYLAAKPGAVAGDIFAPLIRLWRLVQRSPDLVVEDYRKQWKALQRDLPGYYYEVRERFNRTRSPLDLSFLMRTCVNGIARFSGQGGFNNSFHLSRKGMEPDRFERTVYAWHPAIRGVRFVCQDYAKTVEGAEKGDFVYFDPPYAGNKQRYTLDLELDRFCSVLEGLNRRGVLWALSFDGKRGGRDLRRPIPRELYRRRLSLLSGDSAVGKVLNGPLEEVEESLYLNY